MLVSYPQSFAVYVTGRLFEKGEQMRVKHVHGPRRVAAIDDTGDVDLAGACLTVSLHSSCQHESVALTL